MPSYIPMMGIPESLWNNLYFESREASPEVPLPVQTVRPPAFTRFGPQSTSSRTCPYMQHWTLTLNMTSWDPIPLSTQIWNFSASTRLSTYQYPFSASWICLRGAIVDSVQEVDFVLIIDWLWFVLTKKVVDDKSPLALTSPTTTLAGRYLLCHSYPMLTRNLLRTNLSLQRVQG